MTVEIYTSPTCPWCKKAKEFFQEENIEFQEYNVAEDEEKAKEMIEKSGQRGVPVIDVDGEVIVGFDKKRVKKALK